MLVPIESLPDGTRCRLPLGDVGMIMDRVDQPTWRKVRVEVAGNRYPTRIIPFGVLVEAVERASA